MLISMPMKARIRDLIQAVPFQPFDIYVADGRKFRIEHPDLILASSKNQSEVVTAEEEHNDRMHFVSALLITSVEKVSDTNIAA